MCLAGAVVPSRSLTQELTGSSPFTVMTNILGTEFNEFSKTFTQNSITWWAEPILERDEIKSWLCLEGSNAHTDDDTLE